MTDTNARFIFHVIQYYNDQSKLFKHLYYIFLQIYFSYLNDQLGIYAQVGLKKELHNVSFEIFYVYSI